MADKKLLGLLLVVLILIAGCGEEVIPPTTTPISTHAPTNTPTPRSTPLPTVPSPVPLGGSDRPVKIVFIGETPAPDSLQQEATDDLTDMINESLKDVLIGVYKGITVQFNWLDGEQLALDALCGEGDTLVFTDVFTYFAAETQCGARPVLQVGKGRGSQANTGTTFEFVGNTSSVVEMTINYMQTKRFCVLDTSDLVTYIYPAMVLKSRIGLDLLDTRDVEIVTDGLEDEDGERTDIGMLQAMNNRNRNQRPCDFTALPAGRFAEIVDELERDDITLDFLQVIEVDEDMQWPVIPYLILVAPPEHLLSTAMLEAIVDTFAQIEDDDNLKSDLQRLIEHDRLLNVTLADYNALREVVVDSGWNMAASATN